VAAAPKVGLWAFVYQARLDSTMLLGCLFLFAVGAGAWSLDAWWSASARKSSQRYEDSGDGDLFETAPGDLFETALAEPYGRSRSTRDRGQDQSARVNK
jgi:hypothetical protein